MRIIRAAALAATVLIVSSCSKLRSMGGGASATPQASGAPVTGSTEDGEEVHHVLTGPASTRSGKDQGWHVQPLKCSVDERILDMCGDSPIRPAHSSTYVPSFQTPHPPVWRPLPQPGKHH